ncbi:protein SSXT isoform X2 [Betta splendens]|uniref:Protein SSXT isoform X2 n=1 Tax=Betta splendens TaxID=158456 RepID=A0A9W2XDJ0_BETSP|nr:protein SSXT isoform X2 [Betta splendens]
MSVAFAPHRQRGKGDITPAGIQKLLDENNQLIQCIMDFQSKGKTAECSQYQQMLHRNLVYLATIADSNQNMQSLLPAPPTQNMPMGPGGMSQSGPPSQPPHGHNMPSEGMVSGGPPAPHMPNQMNGQMPGPNHMPMQGPGPGPNQPPNMPSGSINMPPSSHGSMGGYNHTVPSSQGMPAQSQMNMTQGQPMGNYGPRPNMNMQPNQGPIMHQQAPAQQYNMPPGGGGQHYQGQQNPMGMMGQVNQGNHVMGQRPMPPYRPPQQGNAQYGQQQEAYQQGPPQQQGYPPQQQYPGQQGYPPQQQGYEPELMSVMSQQRGRGCEVHPKVPQDSTPIIPRGRDNNMEPIAHLSLVPHRANSSALTVTTRANMEITSNERWSQQPTQLCSDRCLSFDLVC